MIDRKTGRLIVKIVKKRNAETLIPIIQQWISIDTEYIISDERRAYNKLKNLKYNHQKINHSKNFVDKKNSLIHTQTIENRWGQIKSMMKKRGRISRFSFHLRIKEIVWRIMNHVNIQEKMLRILLRYNY